jgi:tetratricopeptide (TPR) repeat protein
MAIALFNIGNAFHDHKCWKFAIKYYKKAIDADPTYPDVYHNLGLAYGYLPDHTEAEHFLKKSLEFRPEFPPTHLALGFLLFSQQQLTEARSHLQKYLELEPDSENSPKVRSILSGSKEELSG